MAQAMAKAAWERVSCAIVRLVLGILPREVSQASWTLEDLGPHRYFVQAHRRVDMPWHFTKPRPSYGLNSSPAALQTPLAIGKWKGYGKRTQTENSPAMDN